MELIRTKHYLGTKMLAYTIIQCQGSGVNLS